MQRLARVSRKHATETLRLTAPTKAPYPWKRLIQRTHAPLRPSEISHCAVGEHKRPKQLDYLVVGDIDCLEKHNVTLHSMLRIMANISIMIYLEKIWRYLR
jgi:hypothetical protein